MFVLEMKWKKFKKDFWKQGGFKNPKYVVLFLLFLWALYAHAKEKGWLRKKRVNNKHIYITGAGSGLGRGMTLKFAKLGARLTISDINEEGLNETKRMVKQLTGTDSNILSIKCDISNRQAIADSATEARNKFGHVDIIINNAGIVQGKQMMDMNETMISKSLIVNLECHFWIIREFLPHMLETNKGQIVSVASMAGVVGNPFMVDYCASKFGAIGMMESLRLEHKRAKKNILCTTICPFFTNTGMFEGAKGSILFPILDQDYVIRRMTDGIL